MKGVLNYSTRVEKIKVNVGAFTFKTVEIKTFMPAFQEGSRVSGKYV
jgi:hypothetical protein